MYLEYDNIKSIEKINFELIHIIVVFDTYRIGIPIIV